QQNTKIFLIFLDIQPVTFFINQIQPSLYIYQPYTAGPVFYFFTFFVENGEFKLVFPDAKDNVNRMFRKFDDPMLYCVFYKSYLYQWGYPWVCVLGICFKIDIILWCSTHAELLNVVFSIRYVIFQLYRSVFVLV